MIGRSFFSTAERMVKTGSLSWAVGSRRVGRRAALKVLRDFRSGRHEFEQGRDPTRASARGDAYVAARTANKRVRQAKRVAAGAGLIGAGVIAGGYLLGRRRQAKKDAAESA